MIIQQYDGLWWVDHSTTFGVHGQNCLITKKMLPSRQSQEKKKWLGIVYYELSREMPPSLLLFLRHQTNYNAIYYYYNFFNLNIEIIFYRIDVTKIWPTMRTLANNFFTRIQNGVYLAVPEVWDKGIVFAHFWLCNTERHKTPAHFVLRIKVWHSRPHPILSLASDTKDNTSWNWILIGTKVWAS